MADGSLQLALPDGEITVDLFAGGGGASTGIEEANGRPVDVAINHNANAVSMHQVNHPHADHYTADVYEVCPLLATHGRRVKHLHASPDCTDHSQAKGGQPRNEKRRALSWVVLKWAGTLMKHGRAPRVITLENVAQILKWSPLIAKRCPITGRVVKTDLTVAAPGERVPRDLQYLVPDKRRLGETWHKFVAALRAMCYTVQWRTLKACDFGAPTIRDRLFMVARCDGQPIRWPEPTHHKLPKRGQRKWRSAAECIDFSIPCPSIFDRKRPLATATMRRIAKGVDKFVIKAAEPFIVEVANWSRDNVRPITDPLPTITATPKGGAFAVVSPVLAGVGGRAAQIEPRPVTSPIQTITAKGDTALIAATLAKFRGDSIGADIAQPLPTITSGAGAVRPAGAAHALGLVTAFLAQQNGGFNTTPGHDARSPLSTVQTTGSQQQLVECTLSAEHTDGALRVAAFLMHFYSSGGQWSDLRSPAPVITTKDRLALVTVLIQGTPYVIVDIGLRMLQPSELYRAQGFPSRYVITHGHDGRKFTKSQQVHMVGNSVSPHPMAAVVRANLHDMTMEAIAA